MADAADLILTPTSRMARAARMRQALEHRESGRGAWRTPQILSFPAWLERLRDDALLDGAVPAAPIGADRSRLLWQQAIDQDIFVGEPRVAELAQRAWRTLHEYRLPMPSDWPEPLLSEDAARFRSWVSRFESRCAEHGVIDEWAFAARLPDWIPGAGRCLPGRIALVGQELPPTPLQRSLFDALRQAGVEVTGDETAETPPSPVLPEPAPALQCFGDPDDELSAAAHWARACLSDGSAESIAIVVPDLGARLDRVERIFREVFDPPGFRLETRGAAPWHVSLGRPLGDWPLVSDALALLGLDAGRIEQSRACRMLRSPWLAGWGEESGARAATQRRLMNSAPFEITAREWAREAHAAGARRLAAAVDAWTAVRAEHRRAAWPSEWVGRFQDELKALGFGRGRALDSREYQVLARWHDLLEEFGALDVVAGRPLPRARAVAALADRAASTTFRERDPGCPVEILGVEEALGSRFDAAWITTLDSEHWPKAPRRDPLIPGPVQAEVPTSHGDGCLARARAELAGLFRSAPVLRTSFSSGSDEQPREPTPLLAALEVVPADPAPDIAPVAFEIVDEDVQAPPVSATGAGGGTGLLRDQAACPFRAFARHRLRARELRPPRPGLDAAERGTLAHRALELFWGDLAGREDLHALDATQLDARIERCAEQALEEATARWFLRLEAGSRALEQRCLVRALHRWLDIERGRGEFRIAALERSVEMHLGALQIRGTVDRVDETPAGTVLIDYKTGRATKNAWRPEPRMVDPQLPAYALALDTRPAAIAFARLAADDPGFDGLAETDPGIPGVTSLDAAVRAWKQHDDWSALLAEWSEHLASLADQFAEGRAEVDPRDANACRTCHLHALCRIDERRPMPGDEGEDA
ncbi:MAG: PD-(D/E)XK nuclease family protein [Wenzhouxiangellaceae bacterium]|nr:PD-(D/E)XK nuclease family protein [Wenzhouxiangellaceae bacterium]